MGDKKFGRKKKRRYYWFSIYFNTLVSFYCIAIILQKSKIINFDNFKKINFNFKKWKIKIRNKKRKKPNNKN